MCVFENLLEHVTWSIEEKNIFAIVNQKNSSETFTMKKCEAIIFPNSINFYEAVKVSCLIG